ncbi:hypothetical protein D3C73_772110 [compost metagenome]
MQLSIAEGPLSIGLGNRHIDEIKAFSCLKQADFLAFGFIRCEAVTAFVIGILILSCFLGRGGLEVWFFDGQHVIVDHALGDKRACKLGRHSDGKQQKGCDKRLFGS